MSLPPDDIVTEIVMVPATDPVWNSIEGIEKFAAVLFGGIVNDAVRPPVANCIDGSSLGFTASGWNASVNCPVICDG
jgi:hypothetical protein